MYENLINKAIDNIVKAIDKQDDSYQIAVAAYALQLADHPSKEKVLSQLLDKAYTKGIAIFFCLREKSQILFIFFYSIQTKNVGGVETIQ